MISISDGSAAFARRLLSICEGSPFGARIASYLEAYKGSFPFLDFWVCESEGAQCAVCRYYSSLFLCGAPSGETARFIAMLSPSSVSCSGEWELEIPGMKRRSGEALVCSRPTLSSYALSGSQRIETINGEMRPLRAVYDLLVRSYPDGAPVGDFETFFVDTSHMIRHGASRIYVMYSGDVPVSTVTLSSVTASCAVMGSVATCPGERGKGFAGALVSRAAADMCEQGRRVFLFRESPVRIYERAGFSPYGAWAEYTREVQR